MHPYREDLTFPRDPIAKYDVYWHPDVREHTINLLEMLNDTFEFLEENETVVSFCEEFNFGVKWHVYKQKFTAYPLWYNDGYKFKEDQVGGLPSALKPFLRRLHIKVMRGAFDLANNKVGVRTEKKDRK